MVVDIWAHLDLFDLLRLLRLAGDIRLLLRLVFKFADVEIFSDRRIGVGRNLDQIEPDLARLLHCFASEHHS